MNSGRATLLALLAVVGSVGLTACGGAKAPSVASVATTASSSAGTVTGAPSGGGSAGSGRGAPETPAQLQADALKYSQCMRSHGLPSFPDPSPGGGFVFPAGSGVTPGSPAFQAAQAKCQKYMGGSLPGPGTVTHPAAAWLAQMVKAAGCMRKHGYPDFPDPRTSVPANPFGNGGSGVISDIDGVIFIFPGTIDIKSPQFLRAATICSFPHH